MSFRRGQVVLARFPYADLTRYKKRPCLVVQDETVDTGLSHRVVVQITSVQRTGPTRVPISRDSDDGRRMGLLDDSVVVTDQTQTVEAKALEKAIGDCGCMDTIDAALKRALGLTGP